MEKVVKRKKRTKARYDNSKNIQAAVEALNTPMMRKDLPDFSAGDTVKVHVKIKEGEKERIQAFEGVVLKRSNKSAGKTFTVRKMSHGVGVERIFLETSPVVSKVEIVTKGKVNRSKIYYIRELEGKAAKIDIDVQTNESMAASVAAKAANKAN